MDLVYFFRQHFSFFKKNVGAVFLDSAATSLKPDFLGQSLKALYENNIDIVHRSFYEPADRITVEFEAVRSKIAKKMGVSSTEIIFTSGTTAGLNIAAYSWGMKNLTTQDEILISIAEHHSSELCWIEVAKKTGARIRWMTFSPHDYLFDFEGEVISGQTKVIVISAYSNVLGPLWQNDQQIKKFIKKAQDAGAIVVLDGAQHEPFNDVNLAFLNPDFYAYSAHKGFGPQGVGVLFINKRIHHQLQPVFVGGGSVESVLMDEVVYKKSPLFLEAGTPPAAQIIAWGQVIDFIEQNIDKNFHQKRMAQLIIKILNTLSSIDGVVILGNKQLLSSQGHLVSFVVEDLHAHDLAEILSAQKIFVRAGLMCAQPLFEYLSLQACLRVSLHWYTTEEEIDIFCRELVVAVNRLRAL
jgi:cysteine desulfurase/selenocysteine lyase